MICADVAVLLFTFVALHCIELIVKLCVWAERGVTRRSLWIALLVSVVVFQHIWSQMPVDDLNMKREIAELQSEIRYLEKLGNSYKKDAEKCY